MTTFPFYIPAKLQKWIHVSDWPAEKSEIEADYWCETFLPGKLGTSWVAAGELNGDLAWIGHISRRLIKKKKKKLCLKRVRCAWLNTIVKATKLK